MSGSKNDRVIVVADPTHNLSEELGAVGLKDHPNTVEPKPVTTIRAELFSLSIVDNQKGVALPAAD